MNRKKAFKLGFAICAAAVILCMTVFASGKLVKSIYSSSSSTNTYSSIPSDDTLNKDIGFTPKIVKSFQNGYEYKGGTVINNSAVDESMSVVDKYNSLGCDYRKDNKKLTLHINKSDNETATLDTHTILAEKYNGTDIYYTNYYNKFVPADYELTEQDKEDELNGKLIFSYGSDKVETNEVQSVAWSDNGINYSLLGFDSGLSCDDFLNMAKELIETE